jgi:hypothetical protein
VSKRINEVIFFMFNPRAICVIIAFETSEKLLVTEHGSAYDEITTLFYSTEKVQLKLYIRVINLLLAGENNQKKN